MKKIFVVILAAGAIMAGCSKDETAKSGKKALTFDVAYTSYAIGTRGLAAPEVKLVDGDMVGVTVMNGDEVCVDNARFGYAAGKLASTTPAYFPDGVDSVLVSAFFPFDAAGYKVSMVSTNQIEAVARPSFLAEPVKIKCGDGAKLTFAPVSAFLVISTAFEPEDSASFTLSAAAISTYKNDGWVNSADVDIHPCQLSAKSYQMTLPAQDLTGKVFTMVIDSVKTATWTMPENSVLEPGTINTLTLSDGSIAKFSKGVPVRELK